MFRALTLLVIIALIGGVLQFFLGLGKIFESSEISDTFAAIITDMLTLFVLGGCCGRWWTTLPTTACA